MGASRKSSAERLGGVSTTMRSHAPVLVPGVVLAPVPVLVLGPASAMARSCPSFSIAMYSCVPAKELDRAW